jgi:acylphosphatase
MAKITKRVVDAAEVEEFLRAAQTGPVTARIDSYRIEEADDAALREGGGGKHGFVAASDV